MHKPAALSGGEQQRTAVARALAIDPVVLLADEPSGNLDHSNSERLHDLFVELSRDLEIAMVIATHNRSLAAACGPHVVAGGRPVDGYGRARGCSLMLCDSCRERDAVVHLTTIENNAVHQLHLCERCAAERGVETTSRRRSIRSANSCIGASAGGDGGGDVERQRALQLLQHDDGRFPRDRPVGMRALLHELRGGHSRVAAARPWQPSARGPIVSRRRCPRRWSAPAVLGELKDRLRRAIESEQFELAADLRDRIRVME